MALTDANRYGNRDRCLGAVRPGALPLVLGSAFAGLPTAGEP